MDDLGLVEAVDGFGESIVVRVADATHRRLDAGLGQALGVSDGDVLGGFKRSSQHDLCRLIGETGQAPLRVSSNQASFGAAS